MWKNRCETIWTVVGLLTAVLLIVGCGEAGSELDGDGDCSELACGSHGHCVEGAGGAACVCDEGYEGTLCDRCAEGFHWEGDYCMPGGACDDDPCIHGLCVDNSGRAECVCDEGYDGDWCETCAPGYVPDGLLCVPASACDPNPCIHGVCRIGDDGPECLCDTGYAGEFCDECAPSYVEDDGECVPDTENACLPNPCTESHRSRCITDGEGYRCDCDDGYYDDNGVCVEGAGPCLPNPCEEPNRGVCEPAGEDSFVCRCDVGYHEENGECVESSACEPNPCNIVNRTICVEAQDGHECLCDPNYHLEVDLCVADDACHPNPCEDPNRTWCVETPGTYDCQCDPGYHDDAGSCAEDTVCNPVTTCTGRGACTGNGLECACGEGYAGDHCEICDDGYYESNNHICMLRTPCQPNPCNIVHTTDCRVVGDDGYECGCDDGYQDVDDNDTCLPDCSTAALDCGAFGGCEIVAGMASCVCEQGFGGTACDIRGCTTEIVYRDTSGTIQNLYIRGEFNGWGEQDKMTKDGDTFHIVLDLSPGDYAYKFWDKDHDTWFRDEQNPYTMWVGDSRNSRLRVFDCDEPMLVLSDEPVVGADSISFDVQFIRGNGRDALDSSSVTVTRSGASYSATYDEATRRFSVRDTSLDPGKYGYLFKAADTAGHPARPLFAPLWVENTDFDWRDGIIYFTMTDRFKNGDAGNDQTAGVEWAAEWQGGDFAGIIDKLEDGYFESLGVNVLWISSISENTPGTGAGMSDGHMYSGYHSYWPISSGWTDDNPLAGVEPVDPHFGDLDEFRELVEAAHARGIRVLVDFVANHVHASHPFYVDHQNDGWFHMPPRMCGDSTGGQSNWDVIPIECWFTDYLPDLEYKSLDVTKAMTDHAVWLVQETNIDGFRMDAVKHMIHDIGWTLRARIDEEVDTTGDTRFYMVGETFTGEGQEDLILAYIGEDELDGQFDFPLYWNVMAAFLHESRDLSALSGMLASNEAYYPDSAILSNFMGNHDVARAISQADGNIGDAWSNPPDLPNSDQPFDRMKLAWSFLFTIPGLPLIYYGDEIGMPGSGDPDNRRMMMFEPSLSARPQDMLDHVRLLGQIRRDHPVLARGLRSTLYVTSTFWAYGLQYGSQKAVVVLNRSNGTQSQSVNLSSLGITSGTLTDQLNGGTVSVSGGSATISVEPYDARILVP